LLGWLTGWLTGWLAGLLARLLACIEMPKMGAISLLFAAILTASTQKQ